MNFIGYYIIGLPLGITLALKLQWGVLGLWIGMNFGCAFLVRLLSDQRANYRSCEGSLHVYVEKQQRLFVDNLTLDVQLANCTLSITKNLHCFSPATATENDVTS